MGKEETHYPFDIPRQPGIQASEEVTRHEQALAALEKHLGSLFVPALDEIIRALSDGVLDSLSGEDLQAIADRRVVQVNGRQYFGRAFTGGKDTEIILRIAKDLGPVITLEKLSHLRGILEDADKPDDALAA